jgi:hypothetical protein
MYSTLSSSADPRVYDFGLKTRASNDDDIQRVARDIILTCGYSAIAQSESPIAKRRQSEVASGRHSFILFATEGFNPELSLVCPQCASRCLLQKTRAMWGSHGFKRYDTR